MKASPTKSDATTVTVPPWGSATRRTMAAPEPDASRPQSTPNRWRRSQCAYQRGRFSMWTAARRSGRTAPRTVGGYWLRVASPTKNSLPLIGLANAR